MHPMVAASQVSPTGTMSTTAVTMLAGRWPYRSTPVVKASLPRGHPSSTARRPHDDSELYRLPYDRRVRELLRPVWDEPRPAGPPVRVWRDWALVAVLVPAAIVEGLLRPDLPGRVISVVVAVGL